MSHYMIFAESCPPQVKWRIVDRFCSTLRPSPDDGAAWRLFETILKAEAAEIEDLREYRHLCEAWNDHLERKRAARPTTAS
jgi:hypothetical protein